MTEKNFETIVSALINSKIIAINNNRDCVNDDYIERIDHALEELKTLNPMKKEFIDKIIGGNKIEEQLKVSEFIIDDDYIKEVNAAYWAEEEEIRLGIHPLQIRERIEKYFISEIGENFGKITKLDWDLDGARVGVFLNNSFYGVFDYDINEFENTPDMRLTEILEENGFELNRID